MKVDGAPTLAVEILSPSTARRDRDVKRRRYLEAGVEEVWLVDPAAKTVEVHRADCAMATDGEEAARSIAIPGFEIVPAAFFASGS